MGSYNSDSDLRLVQQGKRMCLDIIPFGITTDNDFLGNNGTIDEDYKRFLCDLEMSGTWREHEPSQNSDGNGFGDAEEEEEEEAEEEEEEEEEYDDEEEEEEEEEEYDEEEEEEDEPEYKTFLANLQSDGDFYALQVVADDCRPPLLLKYHGDFSDDELEFISAKRKVPEKEQVVYKRNLRSNMKRDVEKNMNNVLGKDKGEIQPSTKNVLIKEKMGMQKGMMNVPSKDKKEKQKSVKDVLSKRKREIEKGGTNHLSKRIRCSLKETEKVSHKGHHGLGKKPGGYSQKPTPHGNKSFMTESCYEQEAEIGKRRSQRGQNGSKHEVQGDKIDGDYKTFLDCLSSEGVCLVLRTNNGPCVRYEDYDDDSSDSEVLVASNISDLGKGTPDHFESARPSILVEEDGRQCRADASRSDCSEFRKKLMEKLRKPYDKEEHKKLWELLNERKYKLRHIDLRGSASAKSFLTDECSDSYLEHFDSLKIRIDAVKTNRHKVLNLMRGFFFWLEHVAHDGKFQPWLDEKCLKVMPGSL